MTIRLANTSSLGEATAKLVPDSALTLSSASFAQHRDLKQRIFERYFENVANNFSEKIAHQSAAEIHKCITKLLETKAPRGAWRLLRDILEANRMTSNRALDFVGCVDALSGLALGSRDWSLIGKAASTHSSKECSATDLLRIFCQGIVMPKALSREFKLSCVDTLLRALGDAPVQALPHYRVRDAERNLALTKLFQLAVAHQAFVVTQKLDSRVSGMGLRDIAASLPSLEIAADRQRQFHQLLVKQKQSDDLLFRFLNRTYFDDRSDHAHDRVKIAARYSAVLVRAIEEFVEAQRARGAYFSVLSLHQPVMKFNSVCGQLADSHREEFVSKFVKLLMAPETDPDISVGRIANYVDLMSAIVGPGQIAKKYGMRREVFAKLLFDVADTPGLFPSSNAGRDRCISVINRANSAQHTSHPIIHEWLSNDPFGRTLITDPNKFAELVFDHRRLSATVIAHVRSKFSSQPVKIADILCSYDDTVPQSLNVVLECCIELTRADPESYRRVLFTPFGPAHQSLFSAGLQQSGGLSSHAKACADLQFVGAGTREAFVLSSGFYFQHLHVREVERRAAADAAFSALYLNDRPVKHLPKLSNPEKMHCFMECVARAHALTSGLTSSTNPDRLPGVPRTANGLIYALLKGEAGDWDVVAQRTALLDWRALRSVRDMILTGVNSLLLPEVYLQLGAERAEKLNVRDVLQVSDALVVPLAEVIFRNMGLTNVAGLSQSWHERADLLSDHLRDLAVSGSWRSLIPEKFLEVPEGQLKGWKVVCLTNGEELKGEGQALLHCVGGYAHRMKAGDYHILSIRDPGERSVSTAGLSYSKFGQPGVATGGKLVVDQHHGWRNGRPAAEAQAVLDWFLTGVNDRSIMLGSPPFGAVMTDGKTVFSPIIEAIGFLPSPERNQKAFATLCQELRVGRRGYFIPGAYRSGDLSLFLAATGLKEKVALLNLDS